MNEIPPYWQKEVAGSSLVSIKVGGLVQYLAKPSNLQELKESLKIAVGLKLPIKMIGGGSNLLIADQGFRGIMIQPALLEKRVLGPAEATSLKPYLDQITTAQAQPRYLTEPGAQFLHLDESTVLAKKEQTFQLVEIEAGVSLGLAVNWTLSLNLTGLHLFARIPCQMGGAVYNNIHGGRHFLSEYIVAVRAVQLDNQEERLFSPPALEWGYDHSLFHHSGFCIRSVILALPKVSKKEIGLYQQHYREWNKEKSRVQPAGANCGSVFANLSAQQAKLAGQKAVAAAWYIDQSGLRGKSQGGMQVYPGQANFIINTGSGTQTDFITLVTEIRQKVYQRFAVSLEPEAECLDLRGNRLSWPILSKTS